MLAARRVFFSSLILMASTVLARAADPITLRVADSFPKGHYLVKLILEPWMDEVKKRTNNAVTFEHYPAQQLGKAADMLKLTQTGVADIGYVAPAYTSDKMPVSEVAMLPGAFEHSCQGTLAYWKLARSGVIAEQDYAANNIRLLLAVSLPQYRIFTVKQPVKDVGDVTGLKLRSTGGAQDLTLRAIGAVPVRMAAPDAYESLSRGTMDGLLFPLESVVAYGADKLVKYSTDGLGNSTQPLSGFELFGTVDGSELAAYAGGSVTGAKAGVFAKIEKNGWTGIAFVNTEDSAASVTLTAYNENGIAIATQVLPVSGHAKVVNLAEAIFSQDIRSATYIAYSSDRNVVGFQINATTNGMMFDGGTSAGMMLDGLPALASIN